MVQYPFIHTPVILFFFCCCCLFSAYLLLLLLPLFSFLLSSSPPPAANCEGHPSFRCDRRCFVLSTHSNTHTQIEGRSAEGFTGEKMNQRITHEHHKKERRKKEVEVKPEDTTTEYKKKKQKKMRIVFFKKKVQRISLVSQLQHPPPSFREEHGISPTPCRWCSMYR